MRLGSMDADSGEQKIKFWSRPRLSAPRALHDKGELSGNAKMEQEELAIVRRAYAKQIMVPFNAGHPRVEAAFAAVPRGAYLGPGPWPILHSRGYVTTPDDDPVYLYQDLLVGIIPERGLNNGRPSFQALLIAAAAPLPGDRRAYGRQQRTGHGN
jgi:hypothetical protein